MKKMNLVLFLFKVSYLKTVLLFTIIIMSSCYPDKPEEFIPDYEKGYIITCKIDGEDWFHFSGRESHPESIDALFIESYFGGGLLSINAYNEAKNPFDNVIKLWLRVDEDYNFFKWAINDPLSCYRDFYLTDICGDFKYSLDHTFNNTFMLESFDSINQEVIGRFDLRAINTTCSDTVYISDGYFDVFYEKY